MVEMYHFSDVREYLRAFYEDKKATNPIFSHRYIGQKVGFSPGYFSRLLTGEKSLSDALMEKFIQFLQLSGRSADYFRAMTNYSQCTVHSEKNRYYQQMLSLKNSRDVAQEKQGYTLFSEWSHSAVFSLCRVEYITEESDLSVIGQRFSPKISADSIRKSLKLLTKMNLIEKGDDGEYCIVNSFLRSIGDESIHVQNYLSNSISSAEHALDSVARNEREISTMMLTVSEDGYCQIQEKLKAVRREINEIVAQDDKVDRICQTNLHLFPLYKK